MADENKPRSITSSSMKYETKEGEVKKPFVGGVVDDSRPTNSNEGEEVIEKMPNIETKE